MLLPQPTHFHGYIQHLGKRHAEMDGIFFATKMRPAVSDNDQVGHRVPIDLLVFPELRKDSVGAHVGCLSIMVLNV